MTLKYIAFYDALQNRDQLREVAPPTRQKMDSILNTLSAIGRPAEIISMSSTTGTKSVKNTVYTTPEGHTIRLFWSCGTSTFFRRLINHFAVPIQMFFYLLFTLRKEDQVIVYHSLRYMPMISALKRFIKFRLILEMEEIYADVIGRPEVKPKELALAELADAYIFPTQLLDRSVNTRNKPSVIIHGTYQADEDRHLCFGDGKIHVVYAGAMGPGKGSDLAVQTAMYLSEKYHVHVLGHGDEAYVRNIREQIQHLQGRCQAELTYEGQLFGQDYTDFLQKCQIGLSPQNPDAEFNGTSFPSKVLSYMASGLRVVSIDIPAIRQSAVGDMIFFYREQSPEKIAEVIQGIDLSADYDSRQRLRRLNTEFMKNLQSVLS